MNYEDYSALYDAYMGTSSAAAADGLASNADMAAYMQMMKVVALKSSLVSIFVAIFTIVCMWLIFKKAGRPGWASLIPIYNSYVQFDISMGKGWMFLLMLIPVVNIVIAVMCMHGLSKHFGKGGWFTVGLLFLTPIFYAILAFDKNCVYNRDLDGEAGVEAQPNVVEQPYVEVTESDREDSVPEDSERE